MIKSLPNLYSFLKLSEAQLTAIIENLDYFYTFRRQPKIKYGEFQKDNIGEIRYRELLIPGYILKSKQKIIAEFLSKIDLPDYMFGSVIRKNNILNAQQHLNHNYFFTVDLKKFFQNISHHQVYNMFIVIGFSPAVSRILTKLTTYRSCLPQGAPSSPVIGNLILKNTSDKLFNLAKTNNITFTTFLDDLSFSSKDCFKKLIAEIIDIIKQGGFYPSYNKIHYRKAYCEITGLFIKGNILELPYKMAKRAQRNVFLQQYQRRVQEYNIAMGMRALKS